VLHAKHFESELQQKPDLLPAPPSELVQPVLVVCGHVMEVAADVVLL